ncbi:hypothetical protein DPEC_G00103350 [Dallia pectoralis]|uniref:Uncharacterized protein n=1 Tax=Dallia pectoralis TaxID=75939 RepID=A0ACC2GWZ5_DALPE|nr:hypothetical protein DPEC_G00103350 [Dallia pectoralis]
MGFGKLTARTVRFAPCSSLRRYVALTKQTAGGRVLTDTGRQMAVGVGFLMYEGVLLLPVCGHGSPGWAEVQKEPAGRILQKEANKVQGHLSVFKRDPVTVFFAKGRLLYTRSTPQAEKENQEPATPSPKPSPRAPATLSAAYYLAERARAELPGPAADIMTDYSLRLPQSPPTAANGGTDARAQRGGARGSGVVLTKPPLYLSWLTETRLDTWVNLCPSPSASSKNPAPLMMRLWVVLNRQR